MVRDSIHVKDSVLVIVKGDTVTEFRYKYVYRDKAKTDTLYVSRTDTIRVPYPVEAKLTKWQQFKMEAGGYAISTRRYPCNCCGRMLCDENQEITITDGKGRFFYQQARE